jgi:hypothetical protein
LSSCLVSAQQVQNSTSNFWENVRFGGGIGLNVGNNFFSGALAPNAMYRFNNFVSAGVGLNALYSSQRNVFKSTVLGGSVFGIFLIHTKTYKFLQSLSSYMSTKIRQPRVANADEKYWYPALFLGLGYSTGYVTFGIRYDVLYNDERSIQPQAWMPFVRVTF